FLAATGREDGQERKQRHANVSLHDEPRSMGFEVARKVTKKARPALGKPNWSTRCASKTLSAWAEIHVSQGWSVSRRPAPTRNHVCSGSETVFDRFTHCRD